MIRATLTDDQRKLYIDEITFQTQLVKTVEARIDYLARLLDHDEEAGAAVVSVLEAMPDGGLTSHVRVISEGEKRARALHPTAFRGGGRDIDTSGMTLVDPHEVAWQETKLFDEQGSGVDWQHPLLGNRMTTVDQIKPGDMVGVSRLRGPMIEVLSIRPAVTVSANDTLRVELKVPVGYPKSVRFWRATDSVLVAS